MGKKKIKQKSSVFAVIEGKKREKEFLRYLKSIYLDPRKVNFREDPRSGGNPNWLIDIAIRNLHFPKVLVWIDEDKEIDEGSRNCLFEKWVIKAESKDDFNSCPLGELQQKYNNKNRNPILIVSQPISVESLILRTLGKVPCHNKIDPEQLKKQLTELKSSLKGVFGKIEEFEYYQQNLPKEKLEEKRQEIKELDLLISSLIFPDPNNNSKNQL